MVQLVLQRLVQAGVLDGQPDVAAVEAQGFELLCADIPACDHIIGTDDGHRFIPCPGGHGCKVLDPVHFIARRNIIFNIIVAGEVQPIRFAKNGVEDGPLPGGEPDPPGPDHLSLGIRSQGAVHAVALAVIQENGQAVKAEIIMDTVPDPVEGCPKVTDFSDVLPETDHLFQHGLAQLRYVPRSVFVP